MYLYGVSVVAHVGKLKAVLKKFLWQLSLHFPFPDIDLHTWYNCWNMYAYISCPSSSFHAICNNLNIFLFIHKLLTSVYVHTNIKRVFLLILFCVFTFFRTSILFRVQLGQMTSWSSCHNGLIMMDENLATMQNSYWNDKNLDLT